MPFFPLKPLLLCIGVFCFVACVGSNEGNRKANLPANLEKSKSTLNENANVAKDDVSELGTIINLPFEPDLSSVWREIDLKVQAGDRIPGPNDRKLVAVLKFTPENSAAIVAKAETYQPPTSALLEVESWYPPELIAQSGNSGDETLKGNSYAANDFIKAPFISGKLIRVENTDLFILELTTY
jgi:hypothetical protein